jgi:hypothetical protein
MQKKKNYKIKIRYSNSHANETHLWPGEHRLKSSIKKKMLNASTSEPELSLTIKLDIYTLLPKLVINNHAY